MAAQTPHLNLEDLAERVRTLEERLNILTAPKPWYASLWALLPHIFSGITMAGLLGGAFWLGSTLGSLDATVKQHTDKINKLYDVTLESKDSITAQLSAANAKLDAIDKRLAELSAAK